MKFILEIISLFTGGLFGALVGAHFKTGNIEPWMSRLMSVLASFIIIIFIIDNGYIDFSKKAFSAAAGIAFAIETMGQSEISLLFSKFFNKKAKEVLDAEKKK